MWRLLHQQHSKWEFGCCHTHKYIITNYFNLSLFTYTTSDPISLSISSISFSSFPGAVGPCTHGVFCTDDARVHPSVNISRRSPFRFWRDSKAARRYNILGRSSCSSGCVGIIITPMFISRGRDKNRVFPLQLETIRHFFRNGQSR